MRPHAGNPRAGVAEVVRAPADLVVDQVVRRAVVVVETVVGAPGHAAEVVSRALADLRDQGRVAGAVADVGEARAAVEGEDGVRFWFVSGGGLVAAIGDCAHAHTGGVVPLGPPGADSGKFGQSDAAIGRAGQHGQDRLPKLLVCRSTPRRHAEDHLLVEGRLLQVGEDQRRPGVHEAAAALAADQQVAVVYLQRRQAAHRRMVIVHRQADLLEIVGALHPPRRLPGRLHRRQQQRNEDPDDGDHHQQLH